MPSEESQQLHYGQILSPPRSIWVLHSAPPSIASAEYKFSLAPLAPTDWATSFETHQSIDSVQFDKAKLDGFRLLPRKPRSAISAAKTLEQYPDKFRDPESASTKNAQSPRQTWLILQPTSYGGVFSLSFDRFCDKEKDENILKKLRL